MEIEEMEVSTSYMSFENVPDEFRLDNGTHFPKKMYFKNTYFDEDKNSFYGWLDHRECPAFHGVYSILFKLKFSDDYKRIVGGYLQGYDPDHQEISDCYMKYAKKVKGRLNYKLLGLNDSESGGEST